MKFILFAALCAVAIAGAGFDAEAATKKKGRSAYSKAQQKQFYEQALKGCRKKYGTALHYVKVDYSTSPPGLWCYHY